MQNTTFYELLHNYYIKYSRGLIFILFFLFLAFITLPNLLILHTPGLGSSWLIGINIASIEKMQFGKDIIFTMGPLGFLFLPVFCGFNTWIISAFFTLFVHLLFLYIILVIIKKLSLNIPDFIVMAVVFLFAIQATFIEYKLLFIISALFYLVMTDNQFSKYSFYICVLISFFMAICSLIKFTAMIVSIYILLFMIIYYIYKKKYIYLPLIISTYTSFMILLLHLTGQRISNFPVYLHNSLEISSGYNSAMTINGANKDVIVGFCVMVLLLAILIDSILKRKKDLIFFILINAGFIFVSFKHGYVRHDEHVYIFFANMLLVLMITAFKLKTESRAILQHTSFVVICVLAGFIYHQYPYLLKPKFTEKYRNIYSAVSLIKNNNQERVKILNDNKNNMRNIYDLNDNTLEYIDNKTMDILQWEITLAYAYNMNWRPRPIFQTYSAYTSELDMLNSRYFAGKNAPEILLYGLETIDGRYHLFDTPATFMTILNRYKPVLIDKGYLLLEKSNISNLSSLETISTVNAKIGDTIDIPKMKDGFVFTKIYMDYNILGKVANIFYKAPYATITLKSGENEYKHRFIFSTAKNGVFLSQYIANVEDLMHMWNSKPQNNLDFFTISVGNEYFYNKNVRVEFFQIKPEDVTILNRK